MKGFNRILSMFLAVCLCVCLLPIIENPVLSASSRRDVINKNNVSGDDIVEQAKMYIGIPYTTKGSDYKYRTGFGSTMMFDCSGFVYRVCREVGLASSYKNSTMGVTDNEGKPLEGTDSYGNYYITAHTQNQRYYGEQLIDEVSKYKNNADYSDFKAGDLLFFNYSGGSTVDHVAIYTENGSVIHVTSSKGVVVTSLSQKGWPNSTINKALGSFLIDASRLVTDGYLDKCTPYPSHCKIRVSSSTTYVKSLPCSEKTDANSTNVEVASKDVTYEAIGLVKNTAGNYWYKVKAKNGSIGYMYSGDTTFVSRDISDIKPSGITVPTDHAQGKTYVLTGTVQSSYTKLENVSVYIYDAQGERITGDEDAVTGNKYVFTNSTIDNNTRFAKLTVGTHTYEVVAYYKMYYINESGFLTSSGSYTTVYTKTFNVVNASCSHSYTYKTTKTPTTSAAGTLTGTCSKCSGTKTVSLPKLNTTDYTYAVTKSATCTATGTGRYTWKTTTYGSFYFDVTIAKKAHSWKDATCTAAQTCTVCGTTSGSALGHNYSYKVTTNPTTSAAGTLTGTCSKCSGTKTVSLPKLNTTDYTYAVTKSATCTATGTGRYTWKTTTYGSFYFDVTIAKKAHSWKDATCTAAQTCTVCGTTSGSALGHNYSSEVIAATCTAQGYTVYTCSRCASTYKDNYQNALGHNYVNGNCSRCSGKDPNYCLEYKEDGTLLLIADGSMASLSVNLGEVLDLNGHVLTVNSLASFGQIIDSVGGGGLIVSNLAIMDNQWLPVRDSSGCYRFFQYQVESLGSKETANGAVFGFSLDFEDANAYLTLLDSEDVQITVTLKVGERTQSFAFSKTLLRRYVQLCSKYPNMRAAMKLNVTGIGTLTDGTVITITPAITAAGGKINKIGESMQYIA